MIKNLSKVQYYRSKNLPQARPCKRLEPEPPMRTHLIDIVPSIAQEVERVLSNQDSQGRMAQEYAGCKKIIHTLELEIQTLQTRMVCFQEELECHQTDKLNCQRDKIDLEKRLMELQTRSQKTEFDFKVTLEAVHREKYSFEIRITQLSNEKIELERVLKREVEKLRDNWQSENQRLTSQNRQHRHTNANTIDSLTQDIHNCKRENQKLKEAISRIDMEHELQLKEIEAGGQDMKQLLNRQKAQLENVVILKNADVDKLDSKIKELEADMQNSLRRAERDRKSWESERACLQKSKSELESNWRVNYENLGKIKGQTDERYKEICDAFMALQTKFQDSNSTIKERDRFISDLHQKETISKESQALALQELRDGLDLSYRKRVESVLFEHERKIQQELSKTEQELTGKHQTFLKDQQAQYRAKNANFEKKLHEMEELHISSLNDNNTFQEKIRTLSVELRSLHAEKVDASQVHQGDILQLQSRYQERTDELRASLNKDLQSQRSRGFQIENQLREDIQKKTQQYSARISSLSNELSEKNRRISGFDVQQEELNLRYNHALEEYDERLFKQNLAQSKLEEDLKASYSQVEDLKNRSSEESLRTQATETEIRKMTDAVMRLEAAKKQADRSHQQSLSQLDLRCLKLSDQNSELRRNKAVVISQIQMFSAKVHEMEGKYQQVEMDSMLHKQQNMKLKASQVRKESSTQKLIEEVKQSYSEMNEKIKGQNSSRQRQLHAIIEQKNGYLRELQRDIETRRQEFINLKEEVASFKMDLLSKAKDIQDMSSTLLIERKRTQEQLIAVSSKDSSLGKLKEAMAHLQKELSQANQNLHSFTQSGRKVAKELESVSLEKSELQKMYSQSSHKIREMESFTDTARKEKDAAIEEKESIDKRLRTQINSLTIEVGKLVQKFHEQKSNNDTNLKDKSTAIELLKAQLRTAHNTMQDERESHAKQVKELLSQCNSKTSLATQLRSDLQEHSHSFELRRENLELELQKIKSEKTEVDSHVTALMNKIDLFMSGQSIAIEQIETLKSEIRKQSSHSEQCRTENQSLRNEFSELSNEICSLRSRLSQLQNERITEKENHEQKAFQLKKELSDQLESGRKGKENLEEEKRAEIQKITEKENGEKRRLQAEFSRKEKEFRDQLTYHESEFVSIKRNCESLIEENSGMKKTLEEHKRRWSHFFTEAQVLDSEVSHLEAPSRTIRKRQIHTEEIERISKFMVCSGSESHTERIQGSLRDESAELNYSRGENSINPSQSPAHMELEVSRIQQRLNNS